MIFLDWVSDDDFMKAVDTLKTRSSEAKNQSKTRIEKNVIDPFSSLAIASILGVENKERLVDIQQGGSVLSGISSAIGDFHQNILGSVDGWVNHDAGYDLESIKHNIIAEVKNKHNTMNSGGRSSVVSELNTAIKQKGRGWEAYLVMIIPKKAVRYKKRLETGARPVYEIDGASFYTKVTGEEDALHQLFDALLLALQPTGKQPFSASIESYCRHILTASIPK